MKFIAKPEASKRTKEFLKEYGPDFYIAQSSTSVMVLNDAEGLLLEADDGWRQWVPADEVAVCHDDEDIACFGGYGQEMSR